MKLKNVKSRTNELREEKWGGSQVGQLTKEKEEFTNGKLGGISEFRNEIEKQRGGGERPSVSQG